MKIRNAFLEGKCEISATVTAVDHEGTHIKAYYYLPNALSPQVIDEFDEYVLDCGNDCEVKVECVTAEGERKEYNLSGGIHFKFKRVK